MNNRVFNIKVRLKNKSWLLAFLTVVVSFIYQLLGLFEIVPPVTEAMWMQIITLLLNVLCAYGVLIDPTTKGFKDGEYGSTYKEPK